MSATPDTATKLPIATPAAGRGIGLSRLSYRREEVVWGYLLLAPTIIGLLVFLLGPAIASILLSLFSTNFITDFRFVGLQNFVDLLRDSVFWTSLGNTVFYVVGHVVPTVVIGLFIASLLNQ